MGGQGSGSGMRWNTTRTKDFVEQYKCIDTRSFPYRYMKDIPERGIQMSSHGVELRVFKREPYLHFLSSYEKSREKQVRRDKSGQRNVYLLRKQILSNILE